MTRHTTGFPDPGRVPAVTQDELKALMAQAAVDYVLANVSGGAVPGVGTGSTVNLFIDAVALHKARFVGAASSSEASTRCLQSHGFTVLDLNEADATPAYMDGTDEADASGTMIKGGGDTLAREKIVAPVAKAFVRIADGSKLVEAMGVLPLSAEMVSMARAAVARQLAALGSQPRLRMTKEGQVHKIDNDNMIVDMVGLHIADPKGLESVVNEIPGVVTVGLLAKRSANALLPGTEVGVQRHDF